MASALDLGERPGPSALFLRGTTLAYLGFMVVLPLVALAMQAILGGREAFAKALSSPFALHALGLTLAAGSAVWLAERMGAGVVAQGAPQAVPVPA